MTLNIILEFQFYPESSVEMWKISWKNFKEEREIYEICVLQNPICQKSEQ